MLIVSVWLQERHVHFAHAQHEPLPWFLSNSLSPICKSHLSSNNSPLASSLSRTSAYRRACNTHRGIKLPLFSQNLIFPSSSHDTAIVLLITMINLIHGVVINHLDVEIWCGSEGTHYGSVLLAHEIWCVRKLSNIKYRYMSLIPDALSRSVDEL